MSRIPANKLYALGWYNEGIVHLKINQFEEAMQFINTALDALPENPDFLIGKGNVYLSLGNYEEAYYYYRRAADNEPGNFRAWLNMGTALMRLENYTDSLKCFHQANNIKNPDGEVWLGIGICLLNLGKTDEASDALKAAIRLKPNQPALWYHLGRIEDDTGKALKLLMRGYRMDPDNIDILLEMTRIYIQMGNQEEAGRVLEQAYELSPKNQRVVRMMEYYVLETTWNEVFDKPYRNNSDSK
ncbi:lipopolysaccharide assembly protein LapB [Methanogenium sp. MK-MG]|uniref:tetratricopeptide repeat protein n=1 Tax=Methanogenium sp. MK-MG TaxID=2599926 RepID=UPI0013EA2302|nr:tetratricopeptide repeat protein [Methanogenium sp. MK-MG]KAF1078908.1 Beta-barrel assembly-enhancing protease [Methanogenium sp. MK-MG]